MKNFLEHLNTSNRILIGDGANGTMLMRYGLVMGQSPEEFNLINPGAVERVHKEHKKAGARLIKANTFGANRIKLGKHNLDSKVREIVKEGVKIARAAAAGEAYVSLTVGPTGELMAPFGTLTFDTAYEVYKEQVLAGIEEGIDLVDIQTMGDLGELRAAILAAKELGAPVSASMSFGSGGRSLMGTEPATFAKVAANMTVNLAAANCLSPENALEALEQIIPHFPGHCYVRPNAGVPTLVSGKTVYPMDPQEFAGWGKKFAEAGVDIIGGCCGTAPEHIEALAGVLENKSKAVVPKSRMEWIASAYEGLLAEKVFESNSCIVTSDDMAGDINFSGTQLLRYIKSFPSSEMGVLQLDMTGVPLNTVHDIVLYAQAATRKPLIFEVDSEEVLEHCLRYYAGIAGIINRGIAEEKVAHLIRHYGGIVLKTRG
ncbi:MAG: homocysteine S-methyltransferase family protein [Bacillota bacterium]